MGWLTEKILSNNFSDTVKLPLSKDETYQCMGNIKGVLSCWKRFLFEFLSMVKHLRLPTFFNDIKLC